MIASVHHDELAPTADESEFRDAVTEAQDRTRFDDVPGLVDYRIGRGIRGTRENQFAAGWLDESRVQWTAVWGPVGDPVDPSGYPEAWRTWETDLLDPILAADPDEIDYTSDEVLAHGREVIEGNSAT